MIICKWDESLLQKNTIGNVLEKTKTKKNVRTTTFVIICHMTSYK